MTDLISKTSLIEWVTSLLVGVTEMQKENEESAYPSMPDDGVLEMLEFASEFERKIEFFEDVIKLINSYPNTSPAPDAPNTEFKQFEKVFCEWVEATNRVNLANKSLDDLIEKLHPDTPPDGCPAEVEDAYFAEIAKLKAICDEEQAKIQVLKNVACFLAYRVSVCFPSAFPNRGVSFNDTLQHIGKYIALIRPAVASDEPPVLQIHWMLWEEFEGNSIDDFMVTAESATIE